MTSELLMDTAQTERFETSCTAAGARFVGGLFACFALVEHEFTGALTYYGLTPRDSRTGQDNFMTQGWFTGLIPITVPIAAASFGDAAWACAGFFDSGLDMAKVPYYPRIGIGAMVELAATELPGVELSAWRRCSAQRRAGSSRSGSREQHGNLLRRPLLVSDDHLCVSIRRGHGDGDHASRQPGRPQISHSLHGGNEVRVRAGRRQRALGTRRIAWGNGMTRAF